MPISIKGFKIHGSIYRIDHAYLDNKPTVDNTPTANSDNLVKSGGVRAAIDDSLPAVTAGDEGKFLRVNASGEWAAVELPSAEESEF